MALKSDFQEASFISSPFVDEVVNPGPTPAKAREILSDGSVRGKALTKKQKGFFGARAGASPERKREKARKLMRKVKTQRIVRRFLDERGTKAKVQ